MSHANISADFKSEPYWWDGAPRPDWPEAALPASADVAVIGSGFTGLSAALTLARVGRGVHVLEAELPGHGASTRNSGILVRNYRTKFSKLAAKYGQPRAVALTREAETAYGYLCDLIRREQISCHLVECGGFVAAQTPRHYERMARELELLGRHVGIKGTMVPRAEQHREIGSDFYHGGMLLAATGALHPGLYHQGLLDRATAAGAEVNARTPVTRIDRQVGGFALSTPRGAIRARDVVLATNGYTGSIVPWFTRRLIPVTGNVAVTERIGLDLLAALLPTGRIMVDSKRNIYSARRSPDGTRFRFAATRGFHVTDPTVKAAEMHQRLSPVFPAIRDVRVEFCWTGTMGFTFDMLPHISVQDGVHYAVGYCGGGVSMATWLGHQAALRLLCAPEAATAFDDRSFPSRPFYRGTPWFLPAVVHYYNARDRIDLWRGRRAS